MVAASIAAGALTFAIGMLAIAIWRCGSLLKLVIKALLRIEGEICYLTDVLAGCGDDGPDGDGEPVVTPAETTNIVAIKRRA